MQKKHLHLVLLLLLAGCSKPQFSSINPYFQKNNELSFDFAQFREMWLLWRGSELQLRGDAEAPEFHIISPTLVAGRFVLQWEAGDQQPPF